MQFVQKIIYERMREIENDLGMWKSWLAYALEKCGGKSLDDWEKLSAEEVEGLKKDCGNLSDEEFSKLLKGKNRLTKLNKRYPHMPKWKVYNYLTSSTNYVPPSGFMGLKWIAFIIMLTWGVFIVLAFSVFAC